MSILTELVHDREGWCNRQRVSVVHQRQARTLMGYVVLAVMATLLMFHSKIADIVLALIR